MILVDAGPMVALIHADDHHHERCKEVLRSLKEPMATVWPPVTEAMYLLGFSPTAQQALWELIERRGILVLPLGFVLSAHHILPGLIRNSRLGDSLFSSKHKSKRVLDAPLPSRLNGRPRYFHSAE